MSMDTARYNPEIETLKIDDEFIFALRNLFEFKFFFVFGWKFFTFVTEFDIIIIALES